MASGSTGSSEGSSCLCFCCRCIGCGGAAKSTENLEEIFCLDWWHLTEGCLEGNIRLQLAELHHDEEGVAMRRREEKEERRKNLEVGEIWHDELRDLVKVDHIAAW